MKERRFSKSSLAGLQIGEWLLEQKLGQGGMSTVFRARHSAHGGIGAIKLLRPEFSQDETLLERFRREALAAGQLHHENVIDIRDFGEDEFYGFYMVMEMLEGLDLEAIIQFSPFPKAWIFPILEQVCSGLHALHEADVVHRDLKPSNIFLVPGPTHPRVKLVDLGIAKLLQTSPHFKSMTRPGVVLGTPSYVAPELLAVSDEITPQVDIYALGVIVYLLLVGRLPLWQETFLAMMTALMWEEPILPGVLRPELKGTDLEQFVMLMLSKDTSERPSSVKDVWEELQACLILFEDPLDEWLEAKGTPPNTPVPAWLAKHELFLGVQPKKEPEPLYRPMLHALGLKGHVNLMLEHGPENLPPLEEGNSTGSSGDSPTSQTNLSRRASSSSNSNPSLPEEGLLAPYTPTPATVSYVDELESASSMSLPATETSWSNPLSIKQKSPSHFKTIETGDLPAFLLDTTFEDAKPPANFVIQSGNQLPFSTDKGPTQRHPIDESALQRDSEETTPTQDSMESSKETHDSSKGRVDTDDNWEAPPPEALNDDFRSRSHQLLEQIQANPKAGETQRSMPVMTEEEAKARLHSHPKASIRSEIHSKRLEGKKARQEQGTEPELEGATETEPPHRFIENFDLLPPHETTSPSLQLPAMLGTDTSLVADYPDTTTPVTETTPPAPAKSATSPKKTIPSVESPVFSVLAEATTEQDVGMPAVSGFEKPPSNPSLSREQDTFAESYETMQSRMEDMKRKAMNPLEDLPTAPSPTRDSSTFKLARKRRKTKAAVFAFVFLTMTALGVLLYFGMKP